jgi:Ca2+-binding RTX toxin-like protein
MNGLIEAVERRILMAADAGGVITQFDLVTFEDGVLTVQGTPGDDRILVDFPAGRFFEGPPLRVTLNGVTKSIEHPGRPGTPEITQIIIRGGAGNDRILVGRVGVGAQIEGGEGNDTILGGDGGDTIDGGAGVDRMRGRGGTDQFVIVAGEGEGDVTRQDEPPITRRVRLAKDGTLRIAGTPTADSIKISEFHGSPLVRIAYPTLRVRFNGQLVSFKLDDVKRIDVHGHGGDDGVLLDYLEYHVPTSLPMTIRGGRGDDYLEGGSGDDLIMGGAGDDYIFAKAGDDTLAGGPGRDNLRDGDGDDTLFENKIPKKKRPKIMHF